MPTITFLPDNVAYEYHEGDSVFEVARRHGFEVNTACIGQGTCGLCRIYIVEGDNHLNEFSAVEEDHLGNVYFLTKERLSCQTYPVGGDVIVKIKDIEE